MRRSILLLVTAAVVGIAFDVGLRGGLIGLGSTVTITALALGVLALAPDRSVERWAFAALAMLAAAGLAWRTSPWIVTLDWLAALAFLGLASSTSADRPLLGSSLVRLTWRASAPPTLGSVLGPVELVGAADTLRRRPKTHGEGGDRPPSALQRTAPAIGRGVLIATPILLVLGVLLASADGVFASFFDIPTPDLANPLPHLLLIGLGAVVLAGLARWTREPIDPGTTSSRPLGPVETIVVLGGLAGLYALFAVAQVIASTGGDDRIQETTGLTYAEYARTGFFQLLWAAAITIAVLLGLRALSRPGSDRQQVAVRVVSAATCALTLVVVGTAITRLDLYRDAYGLTMLRLACTTFAWVLGVAFLLLGARMLQAGGRDWLPAAYLVVAVLTLGWWNASNPEATVVETNIDRAAETGKLDVSYLDTLSDDAIPAILDGLDEAPPALAAEAREQLCARPEPPAEDDLGYGYGYDYDDGSAGGRAHVDVDADGVVRTRPGWAAFNVSRRDATRALQGCADDLGG